MPSKRKATEPDNPSDSTPNPTAAVAAAPTKRSRVTRACDQCRAAREKCDGGQPQCRKCTAQSRPCTYHSTVKKRGVQTGYIKTLEVALAWLFDKVPGCEETLENLLTHEGAQGRNLLIGKDTEKASRVHKRWGKSKVHREIDRILSGGDVSQQRLDNSSPSDDDDNEGRSERALHGPGDVDPARQVAQFSTQASSRPPDFSGSLTWSPKLLKLPSNHWRLLDVYFSFTHCWFPVLEKQDVLKTLYLYPPVGLKVSSNGSWPAAHAELWAALALAAYQDAASSKPTTPNDPEQVLLSPNEIYGIARRLVPAEEGPFQIQHARAILLLALINLGKEKRTCAWILVGLAHRIALDIAPVSFTGESQSSRQVTSVLMGCFILDTLISVRRKGAPSLETPGMRDVMSVPEDSLDEWQPWAPCEGFGQGSAGPSAYSRIPAYSLTTFNQLYEVFKFLRKRLIESQDGRLPPEYTQAVMSALHQTIKPGLPFGTFIVSRDSRSATIPSAYVLRILFLWASALLDSPEGSPCILILESIEQFLSQFGACGAPPFFATCLAMMSQHRSFADLHSQSRARWQALQEIMTSTWTSPPDTTPDAIRPTSTVSKVTGTSDMPVASSLQSSTGVSMPTPPDIYGNNLPNQPISLAPKQAFAPSSSPFMLSGFLKPNPLMGQVVDSSAVSAALNMSSMPQSQALIQGRPGPPLTGHSVPGGEHRESFGTDMLDYDAFLDDLASIDYVDRVDTDAQFMANLGFAPGCDIAEILSREFGAI